MSSLKIRPHFLLQTTGQADQIYAYDAVGNQIQTGLDVDASGSLEPASIDRITETDTAYAQIGSDWWQQSQQKVYATDNLAAATNTGIQRTRLTGLGASGLTAESISIDISGNQSVSKTTIDRSTHTETKTINYPDSNIEAQTLSVNGFMTSSTSKTGVSAAYQYDALGRQTGVTDPRIGTFTTHYNEQGRVDYVQDPAGNRTAYAYDPDTGRKISETNSLGNTTRYAYNLQGQVIHTWGDAAYPVSYEYNAFGQMTAMTTYRAESSWDGTNWPSSTSGDTTTWTYDLTPSPLSPPELVEGEPVEGATGLLIAKTDAAGNATTYTYDASGRLSTRTWARIESGNPLVTIYTYNPATGDLTGINYSDSTSAVTFAYDRLGRQTQIADAAGNRTFAYNDNLQLAQESMTGIINRTLTRNYATTGVPGRSSGLAVNGYSMSYAYDATGRMNHIGWNANTQTGSADYAYVSNADLLASVSVNGNLNTTYNYEPNRNNKTQVQNSYNSQVVSQYDYAYDAFGRRTSVVNTGTAFAANDHNAYGYNDRNELTESARYQGSNPTDTSQPVQPEYRAYQYDPIGNRKTITEAANAGTYTANNLNQYTQQTVPADGTRSFEHDEDGNLTSLIENGSEKVYTWNAENRLVSVAPATPADGSKKVEFIYDYICRRAKKTVSTFSSGSWNSDFEVFFVYDGWNLVEEIKEVGTTHTSRYFVWGLDLSQSLQGAGGIGGLIATVDGTVAYLYCYDGNGNVGQLVNAGNGSIAAKYEYDPYGKPIRAEGSYAVENQFRFSTKYDDDETGLVYYGYRYYSNELGRWVSRDPIGERGGINQYSFLRNSPIGMVDTLGLARFWKFSGVDNWSWSKHDYTNYVKDITRKFYDPNVSGNYQEGGQNVRSQAGFNGLPYIVPGMDGEFLLRLDSESVLDEEADRISEGIMKQPDDHLCCGKIRLLMVAPKTHTTPLSENSCCDFEAKVFWNPYDTVLNQGLFGGRESEDFWKKWGTVYTVSTGGGHSFEDFLNKTLEVLTPNPNYNPSPYSSYSDNSYWNNLDTSGRPYDENPYTKTGNHVNVSSILDDWMKDSTVNDVMICHSQGCNIAMHLINKGCKRK